MRRIILVLALVLGCGSCCHLTGTCKNSPVVTKAIDCTVDAIKTEALNLLPAVIAILTGHAPDWAAQLDSLKTVGKDALACALNSAAQELYSTASTQPTAGETPYGNAVKYIEANHWSYGPAKP